jgi:hypothetical protein
MAHRKLSPPSNPRLQRTRSAPAALAAEPQAVRRHLMNHQEWSKELGNALALHRSGRSGEALDLLSKLSRISRVQSKKSLSLWHERQIRWLVATVLEDVNEPGRAARTFLGLAKEYEGEANGNRHSALDALVGAAICRLNEGKLSAGTSLGRRALRLAEAIGEQNAVLKNLERRLDVLGKRK